MLKLLKIAFFQIGFIAAVSSPLMINFSVPAFAQATAPVIDDAAKTANDNQAPNVPAPNQANNNITLPEIRAIGPVKTFTLSNGLEVLVIENHRAPVVTQMVWYHVGSADEPMGHTGIAHFLEHLMFKGTKNHSEGEFSKFVSKIGGEENAFTSYDYTAYYQSVASQYLPDIMRYEADRMENLVLTDAVIAPERNVIIEERRMRTDNNPEAMLSEEARATLFMNSPYRNPVIGWKQEMEQLGQEDALAFYNKFYTPNNATLVISGDVVAEDVRALSVDIYGKLARRAEIPPRIRPQEPEKRTSRNVTLYDQRVTTPSYQQMWVVPSYKNAKNIKDAAALDLLGEILGGSTRSRLYQSLIVKNGSAASVGSGYNGNAVDDGLFYLYGMPRGDATLEEVQKQVNDQLNDILKNGVTKAELDQARNRYIKDMIFSTDSPVGLAQIYGSSLAIGMTIDNVEHWPELLNSITITDIKSVATRYLDPKLAVVSTLLPPETAVSAKNTAKAPKTNKDTKK